MATLTANKNYLQPSGFRVIIDRENYPRNLKIWDQFTLWWLTEKEEKYKDLKISIFEDNYRWNYWSLLARRQIPPENTVLLHKSSAADRKVYK